ncbi:hypothetical protein BHE74_00008251 [Ensete ventricosum]|uniref:Uncharacterized protein n=1 Tax=Ensete ventricosum TaxID=4639 RepID=A0A444FL44_ENSVE|nr:hypothetical protein GW17_00012401 [Ensete ventricosum]RWW83257.1 hypothetical protein BHE74_00008251 [Ensete ventricosum]RZR74181.1 hypothetical protein BHM03_00033167 [Ensete ventricosum]
MAQVLAPVRTGLLLELPKMSSPAHGIRRQGVAAAGRSGTDRHRRRGRRNFRIAAAVAEKGFSSQDDVAEDFYAVLGLVLSDPIQRMVYDEIHGYAATAINPFFDDSASKDHAFVDEFSCIGMWNCYPCFRFDDKQSL